MLGLPVPDYSVSTSRAESSIRSMSICQVRGRMGKQGRRERGEDCGRGGELPRQLSTSQCSTVKCM